MFFFRNRDTLEKKRRIFSYKFNPLLFTSTAQQINRTCIKSLFEHSSSIHLWIKALLGKLLNGSLEMIECEVYDQLHLFTSNTVCWLKTNFLSCNYKYRIGSVMVSMLGLSAVDREFEPLSGHTKDFKIDMCSFSAKHTQLRRKSTDWLARNQNNVSEWSDMSICGMLFQ